MTQSERVFERFCGERGLKLQRIPEGESKSPDCYLEVGGRTLVVEVKQIDANKEEALVLRKAPDELNQDDAFHWDIPGERLRHKIASAMPQLRILSSGKYPTLLVIYDNIQVWPELTDEYAVRVSMYGVETALITQEVAPEGGARILERWYGPRKTVSPRHNTTLSAIAVLCNEDDRSLMTAYHNWHASIPLERQVLALPGVEQFQLEDAPDSRFCQWKKIR